MDRPTDGEASEEPARQERIDRVVLEYLEALDRGEGIDPEVLLARHADLASDLREFFLADGAVSAWRSDARRAALAGSVPETREELSPGTLLGDYEVLSTIARGGMGTVYRARQRSLSRDVALKVFHASRSFDTSRENRTRIEAIAGASLSHPSIVPVFEIGHADGRDFLALGLVEGEDLAQRLRAGEFREHPAEAARLLATIARAVHHAHGRGVLHRDLKPANIIVDVDGAPHLTDFGLAKLLEHEQDVTLSGVLLGTPKYMAPEQADGNRSSATPAVDVYALGVILYQMLTGVVPFDGDSALEVLHRIKTESPTPPSRILRRVPRDLETICLRCLAKVPRERYASAAELADDLERYVRGEPIRARRAGWIVRSVKWTRRNRALAGALVVVSLAVGGLAWFGVRQGENHVARLYREWSLVVREILKLIQAGNETAARDRLDASEVAATHRDGLEHGYLKKGLSPPLDRWALAGDGSCVGGDHVAFRDSREHLTIRRLDVPHPGDAIARVPVVGSVRSSALWRDGRRLLVADDESVRVVDPLAGTSWTAPQPGAIAAVSTDRRHVAVLERVGELSRISIHDADSGARLRVLEMTAGVSTVLRFAMVRGAEVLFAAQDVERRIRSWDVASWEAGESIAYDHVVHDLAVVDGAHLVIGGDGRDGDRLLGPSLEVVPLAARGETTAERRFVLRPTGSLDPDQAIRSIAISPDGRTLAVGTAARPWVEGSDRAGGVAWYETGTWRLLRRRRTLAEPTLLVAWSASARHLVSASEAELQIWDGRATPGEVRTVSDHILWGLQVLPGGQRVLTSTDFAGTAWRLEVTPSGAVLDAIGEVGLPVDEPVEFAVVSPSGLRIAHFADADSPVEIQWIEYGPNGISGRLESSILVDPRQVKPGGELHWEQRGMEFAPDEMGLVVSHDHVPTRPGEPCGVFSFLVRSTAEPATWSIRSQRPAPESGRTIVFAPDGESFAFHGPGGRRVRVWSYPEGREVAAFPADHEVRHIAFSPDGARIAASARDVGSVQVWDVASGEPLQHLDLGDRGVWALAFTPSGDRLATGGDDGRIGIWALCREHGGPRAIELLALQEHRGAVKALAFTPDGRTLISAGGIEGEFGEVGVFSAGSLAD